MSGGWRGRNKMKGDKKKNLKMRWLFVVGASRWGNCVGSMTPKVSRENVRTIIRCMCQGT